MLKMVLLNHIKKKTYFFLVQIIIINIFVDAGNITNQVVKTKQGHTCVLPTTVDKATNYLFLSNPQPGDFFQYCTIAHTGPLRRWPWCSYGEKFPEVENGSETFKWDYCTEYSWEYEGYKYVFNESTPASTYKDAEKLCNSQNGELPYFESEKEDVEKVETTFGSHLIEHYEKTPIYEGQSKTTVTEALRPLLAFHKSSPDRRFWMKSKPITGQFWSHTSEGKAEFGGFYNVAKCLTVTPVGVADVIGCDVPYNNKAQVLCRIPLKEN